MRTLALLFPLLASATLLAQEPAAPPPIRPVGTMSELMIDVIYPTSDAIFYIERAAPANPVEWNALQGKALVLAESANLLMMGSRARDQDKWMKDARLLLEAGTAAFKAAKARDVDALSALNDSLYTACVTCHADYRSNYRRRPPDPK
jgi:cytochrome c553